VLARHATEEERAQVKIQAAMRGIDVDKAEKEEKEKKAMLVRDPKDYEHMSPEERQELTDKMMGKYRGIFAKGKVKAG
jgi:KaiC/GvpD/RAD55 family RecA-like ATPase